MSLDHNGALFSSEVLRTDEFPLPAIPRVHLILTFCALGMVLHNRKCCHTFHFRSDCPFKDVKNEV